VTNAVTKPNEPPVTAPRRLHENTDKLSVALIAPKGLKSSITIKHILSFDRQSTLKYNVVQRLGKAGSGGQLTPVKFGDEGRKYIWRLCQTGVKVMAMTTCYY